MDKILLFQNKLFDYVWPASGYLSILLVSMVSAIIFLLIFKKLSNQEAVKTQKNKIVGNILQIRLYQDKLVTIICSILSILKHNIFYIGYTIPPLFVIIFPLAILSLQINNRCGYEPLNPGDEFIITAHSSNNTFMENMTDTLESARCKTTAGIALLTPALRIPEDGTVQWRARVRDNADPGREFVRIEIEESGSGKDVAALVRPSSFSPDIVKWSSRGAMIHNAEGFLSAASPFERISISYERAEYPLLWWQMDALVLYFAFTLVFAFVFKPIIKVNI